jgi:hypothetical protein
MTIPPSDQPAGPRVSETRARAGFKDKPVLWVLALSILLAVLVLGGWYFINKPGLQSMNADAGRDRRDAETFDTTPQAPKSD